MKKQEKTELTRERILQAALAEFGDHGYRMASLNAICSGHDISKGLLYHNFTGKDGLYLACVSRCFECVTQALREQALRADLEEYMGLRLAYFSRHPRTARIFFEAVLQPPPALAEEIRVRKAEFDRFNRQFYQEALARLPLRAGVTREDAMAYFEIMQEMFNGYFSSPAYSGTDFQALITDHENQLSKILMLMLYGIAERS